MFLGLAYSDACGRIWINGEVKTVFVVHLLGGWPGLGSGDTDELGMALSSGNPEFRQRDSIPDMACSMHANKVISVMSDCFDPMDWGPPGSSVHGFLQARILE